MIPTLDDLTCLAITRAEAVLPKLQDAPSIVLLEGNIARTKTALREGNVPAMRVETKNLRAWVLELENL